MFLINNLKKKQLLSIMMIVLISVFVFASCDEAKEAIDDTTEAVGNAADKAGEVAGDVVEKTGEVAGDAVEKVGDAADKAGEVAGDVVDKVGEVANDASEKVTDVMDSNKMVGVWIGKLDSRLTTLTITKQDDNTFEGKIVVNYRTPLNQDIKGSYNTETKTITMEDQLHSRNKGKYVGKLSGEGKTFSGTFTTLVDKNSYNFNLTKK